MMKIMRHSYLYFIILIIVLNHSLIINLVTNLNRFITDNKNEYLTEVNILKEQNNYLKEEIEIASKNVGLKDYKTVLQEKLQEHGNVSIEYQIIKETGPDHRPLHPGTRHVRHCRDAGPCEGAGLQIFHEGRGHRSRFGRCDPAPEG